MPYWDIDTGDGRAADAADRRRRGARRLLLRRARPERIDAFRAEFGVPADHRPIGAITLGHRTDDDGARLGPHPRARRPLDDVVHRGGW